MRILALLVPLLLFLPAGALGQECAPTTSAALVDTGETPDGRYYLVNDPCLFDCVLVLFVYEETNGMDGLQRGDPAVDDTCGGRYEADTIVNF